MKTILAEQPWIASLMLFAMGAGLIYVWLQSGKKGVGITGLILMLLIPVAWYVDSVWVTDRERLELIIYEAADAVEQNDRERALAFISDEATRAQARQRLQNFTFSRADVTRINEIRIIDQTFPREADVDLNVVVRVSAIGGAIPRRLLLRFVESGDSWYVTAFQEEPMISGGLGGLDPGLSP